MQAAIRSAFLEGASTFMRDTPVESLKHLDKLLAISVEAGRLTREEAKRMHEDMRGRLYDKATQEDIMLPDLGDTDSHQLDIVHWPNAAPPSVPDRRVLDEYQNS